MSRVVALSVALLLLVTTATADDGDLDALIDSLFTSSPIPIDAHTPAPPPPAPDVGEQVIYS